VLREDFDPAHSDVDVLAEFAPGALNGVGFRYFYIATNFLGHGTVNPKANESDD
jgi:predicted nucleotidyltransferase